MEKNVAFFWMRWKISGKFFLEVENFPEMAVWERFKALSGRANSDKKRAAGACPAARQNVDKVNRLTER